MLLCNNCASNNERDNFIGCRTIEKMNEKIEAEMQEINERLMNIENHLTFVDTKVDNALKTTFEKMENGYHGSHCRSASKSRSAL